MATLEPKQFVKFKNKRFLEHLPYLHPLLVMVIFDMAYWCFKRNIDFVITDAISTEKKDLKLGRVSDAHRTKRAIDLRSRTFLAKNKSQFVKHFNHKYRHIGQIPKTGADPELVVLHGEGDNEHFHIAIHAKYRLYV